MTDDIEKDVEMALVDLNGALDSLCAYLDDLDDRRAFDVLVANIKELDRARRNVGDLWAFMKKRIGKTK